MNRVHPVLAPAAAVGRLRETADSLRRTRPAEPLAAAAAARLADRYDDLADFSELAAREREQLDGVAARLGTDALVFVPELSRDVFDFHALADVGHHLFAASSAPG